MTGEDIEEEVEELKRRVNHLETEVGTSLRERRFESRAKSILRGDVEMSSDGIGLCAYSNVTVEEIPRISEDVEQIEDYRFSTQPCDTDGMVTVTIHER